MRGVNSGFFAVALNGAEPGAGSFRIHLLPGADGLGRVTGRDGRWWLLGDAAAVVSASEAYRAAQGCPLDEGHKMFSAPDAPAYGWFTGFEVRPDGGIDGVVELTDLGRVAIANKHYRYASVVFDFDPETKRIERIRGAGLTNNQNLAVQALNRMESGADLPEQQGAGMEKQLLQALGLPEGADVQQALNALGALVPKADLQQALNRAQTAEQKLAEKEKAEFEATVESALNQALSEKKISPATRAFWKGQLRDQTALNSFREDYLKHAPAVLGADLAGQTQGQPTPALNAAEQDIAALFGNSADDLKQYGGA